MITKTVMKKMAMKSVARIRKMMKVKKMKTMSKIKMVVKTRAWPTSSAIKKHSETGDNDDEYEDSGECE